jgi:AcrR family transcriptional regulator
MATLIDPAAELSPKAERTRAAILAAAQQTFSAHGYAATGIRTITAAAGVNPALVSRYFGSKEGLFEAALEASLDIGLLTSQDRSQFGRRLLDSLLNVDGQAAPLPMLVLATGDPVAREIADRVLRRQVIGPLTAWLGGAEAEVRAARLLLVSAGLFLYRTLYPMAPLEGRLHPAMRSWLEREFQSLVD